MRRTWHETRPSRLTIGRLPSRPTRWSTDLRQKRGRCWLGVAAPAYVGIDLDFDDIEGHLMEVVIHPHPTGRGRLQPQPSSAQPLAEPVAHGGGRALGDALRSSASGRVCLPVRFDPNRPGMGVTFGSLPTATRPTLDGWDRGPELRRAQNG